MKYPLLAPLLLVPFFFAAPAWASPVGVVAAENFYGDVAQQIAGPAAKVSSVLSNPDQDPHLFEASPSVARALSEARVVIENGVDYDPWMDKLLAAAQAPDRITITAATQVGAAAGANPHLWYNPATMRAVARAVAEALTKLEPDQAAAFAARLATFEHSIDPLDARIAALRKRYAGVPVTATEPVFGIMAAALGLDMRNERFQLAVMNGTEPSAGDIAAFETDLRQHRVRLLIYNSQASDAAVERLRRIATDAGVSQVAVTETEPAGSTYQAWMGHTLDGLERALAKPAS